MKKLLIPLLAMVLLISILAVGCGSVTTVTQSGTTSTVTSTAAGGTTTATSTVTSTKVSIMSTTITETENARYGGTLKFVNSYHSSTPPGWPLDSQTNMQVMWYVQFICAEPLATYTRTGEVELWLADDYVLDAGANPSITFTLKKGIKFQDGTDFNADAVKWQLDKVIELGTNNSRYWKSIEVVDPYTVKFNLTKWTNSFWIDVSNTNSFFVSPTQFEEHGIDYVREHLCGTGPFIMTKWEKDVGARFERNPDYWQPGKPYLDAIETKVVPDDITMLMALRSGTAHATFLQEAKAERDMAAAGFNVLAYPCGTTSIVPDSANPGSIFADIRVRQAIDYAMDKQSIADALGYGFLWPTSQLPAIGEPAYDDTIPQTSYDLDKARELLALAGHEGGFKTEIITWPVDINYALIAQEQLAKVGIETTISSNEWIKFADYWMNGWEDAVLLVSASHYPNFAASCVNGWPPDGAYHVSCQAPDGMRELIDECLSAVDEDEMWSLNKKLSRMIYEDKMMINLACGGRGCIISPKVQGHDFLFAYERMNSFRAADTFLVE